MSDRPKNKKRKITVFDIVNTAFLLLFAIIIFYPFYNAILSSIVTSQEYTLNPTMLYPRDVTFNNYLIILENPRIWTGYQNTLIIVFFGVIYSVGMTVCMAYALSRRNFPGKRVIFLIVLFTMFFSGGLIPLYLLMKDLGLLNSLIGLILLNGVSPFFMIIMKNSFEQIPDSLEEAAKIEGANDIVVFIRIMLPLQSAMLATITLFTATSQWNSWFYPMLFIKEGRLLPLQVILRSIIFESASNVDAISSRFSETVFATGIKNAAVVVTMLPIMCIYPFLQKYFVKGIMVGAVKM